MAVSPEVLVGPRLKVQRAHQHIDELIARTAPLSKDWHTVRIERDIRPPQAKPTSFTLRYRPTQPIAELTALIIGDALHNLRGALDHLATGICRSMSWEIQAHFPMRPKREDLISPTGTPIAALDAIEAALPGSVHLLLDKIRPANGSDERLWSFHTLDNDDKHNLILPTIAVASVNGINAKIGTNIMRNCAVGGDATKPINIITSDAPFAAEDNFETVVAVKFGKGPAFENDPVIPTLTQVAQIVSKTLNAFEDLITS